MEGKHFFTQIFDQRQRSSKYLAFFCSALLLCPTVGIAANIPMLQQQEVAVTKVTGTVTDKQGMPLPGVAVMVKGSRIGAATDLNGKYTIDIPSASKKVVLVFSFVGMKTQEVPTEGRKVVHVTMSEDSKQIDEVVVTGYFERKRDSYTGSATTFKGDELREISTGNVLSTLSMVDPSFKLMENIDAGNDPNKIPDFTIHGSGSLQSEYKNSPNMPTFILDGFEVSPEKIFDLDPNRVSTITILKDAAATAIYGSRAANGVVIVESKAPLMGSIKVSYNSSFDFEVADLSDYNLMNAAEKLEYEKRAKLYYHPNTSMQETLLDQYNERLALVQKGVNTDWIAKPIKDVGFSHKHSLYVEGGDSSLRYGLTLNYQDKNGVMKGSGRDNLGIGVQLQYRYKNLKFMNNLTFNQTKMKDSPYGSFAEYTWLNPYYYPYYENGNIKKVLHKFENGEEVLNPMYDATIGTKDEEVYNEFINNFSFEWDILEGLKLKTKISFSTKNSTSDNFLPGDHTSYHNSSLNGSYSKISSKDSYYDTHTALSYNKLFNKHQINAVAVWNVREDRYDSYSTTAYNFPNNNIDHIGMGIEYRKGDKPSGEYEVSRLMGIVGNINYSYDDRYLLDCSVRSDGSSLFGSQKRWGTFGSVGLGWNLHNESWLKDNKMVNRLQLRGSWGTTGGQKFYPFQSMLMYSYKDPLLQGANGGYDGFIGAVVKAYGNNNLKWQKTEKLSAGVDFVLFDNRVSGYVNYYKETSKSVLTDVSVAPSLGFVSYKDNLGQVENKGMELNLRTVLARDRSKDLQWDVFLNMVLNKNRLLKLNDALMAWNKRQDNTTDANQKTGPVVRYQEGESINTIWANQSLGIDPVTGKEVFLDMDGKRVVDWSTTNYKPLGCQDPDFEGNFGTMFRYKGFMLQAYFRYSYGGDIYNQTLVDKVENVNPRMNADKRVLYDRWKQTGDHAKFKAISNTTRTMPTSRFIEEQNYLSLSSLNLSYEFKPTTLQQLGVSRIKLSAIGNELFRTSTVKTERGISYPFARTFSLAAQVTF